MKNPRNMVSGIFLHYRSDVLVVGMQDPPVILLPRLSFSIKQKNIIHLWIYIFDQYHMLKALPYHQQVVHHFKQQTKTWEYFAAAKNRADQLEQFRNELLKSTYKFDPATDAFIYDKVALACKKLDLSLPVYVYQAENTDELNASIVYLEQEAHIVFSGNVTSLLNEPELLAVLAHELSHIKLYHVLDSQVEVADRIITAIGNSYTSDPSYFATARTFKLYTEIFCDRSAYDVTEDINPIITSLVKLATGLKEVNPENYLKQAVEIFSKEQSLTSSGVTHPENFIRAISLQLWRDEAAIADEKIARMIERQCTLDSLDIFQQRDLSTLTRTLLQLMLKPRWMQTTLMISQAKQFFPDFILDPDILLTQSLKEKLESADISIRDYISYLLMDFALVDPELESVPMGRSFWLSEQLQLKDLFDKIVKKEQGLSEKRLKEYKEKALAAYHAVKESEQEQIIE